jgi:hypothetical protein
VTTPSTRRSWPDRLLLGRLVWLYLVVLLGFVMVVLPNAETTIKTSSGGIGPLDLMLSGYSPRQAFDAVAAYGDSREFYANFEVTVDLIYPLSLALVLASLIYRGARHVFGTETRWRWLAVLPGLTLLADYLENVGIVTLLRSHPAQPLWAAQWANTFTNIKWGLAGSEVVLVLLLWLWVLLRWLLTRRR